MFGADAASLYLHDGSIIQGEVLALHDGVYAIRSNVLGEIEVKQSDVARIEYAANSASSAQSNAAPDTAERLRSIQSALVNDAGLMALIMSLQSDPEIRAILSDPAIMQAVAAGDLDALMAKPEVFGLTRQSEAARHYEAYPRPVT